MQDQFNWDYSEEPVIKNKEGHIIIKRKEYWFEFLTFSRYMVKINGEIVGTIVKDSFISYLPKYKESKIIVEYPNAGRSDFFTIISNDLILQKEDVDSFEIEIRYSAKILLSLFGYISAIAGLVLFIVFLTRYTWIYLIFMLFFIIYIISYQFTPGNYIKLVKKNKY